MVRVLERMLVMGPPGAGKTKQWLDIAKILRPKGVKFHCIDTDNAVNFMLATQYKGLSSEDGGNVVVHPCFEWHDYMGYSDEKGHHDGAVQKILRSIKPGDWIIVDMADKPWDAVQRFYTDEIFGVDKGTYFLQARKTLQAKMEAGRKASPLSEEAFKGWTDWVVINALYGDYINKLISCPIAHVYMTAKVQPLSRQEDPATRITYGDYGIKPTGQKDLGHQVHTIMLFKVDVTTKKNPIWYVTTIKDRSGREYFSDIQLVSFYYQYLVAKAGWEVA